MAILPDLLQHLLGQRPEIGHGKPRQSDPRMAIPPLDNGEAKGGVETPAEMDKNRNIGNDKHNIYDEKGNIVDYDLGDHPEITGGHKMDPRLRMLIDSLTGKKSDASPDGGGNPFAQLVNADAPQGTMRNFLGRMMGNDPTNVGSAVTANLDPTPTADQPQANLQPSADAAGTSASVPLPQPRPNIYAQPSAFNPQQIDELRASLLAQTGQMAPNADIGGVTPTQPDAMGQQRNEAMGIEDAIRGFDGGPKPRKVLE